MMVRSERRRRFISSLSLNHSPPIRYDSRKCIRCRRYRLQLAGTYLDILTSPVRELFISGDLTFSRRKAMGKHFREEGGALHS